MEALTPTPASEWKNKPNLSGADLLLPSGNVARVRPMSPQAFLSSGMIPDPLTTIIRKSINDKQGLPPQKMKEISEDPDMLISALEMFDRVLSFVMVAPLISMPPTCTECAEYFNNGKHNNAGHPYLEGERDDNLLYADQVEMEDKVFVFQWCLGGTRDVEKFRDEQRAGVESIQDGQGVQGKAKRAPRSR